MSKILELERGMSAACLLLPQLPGVDIYSFTIGEESYFPSDDKAGNQLNSNRSGNAMDEHGYGRFFSDADVDRITQIPSGKQVRALLLFLTEIYTDSEFGRCLVRRYGANNTLVAGGFADKLLTGSTHAQ